MICTLVAGAVVGSFGVYLYQRSSATDEEKQFVSTLRPTTPVVQAVQKLAKLESIQYRVEKVIDLTDKQSRFGGLMEAKDAILLVAVGEVTAGVDLGKLKDADVQVNAQTSVVHIVLPDPEIFSVRLLSDQTYVHTRQTDLLAKRREDLETRARKEAERSIERAAFESKILEKAQRSAGQTVEGLLHSLGYQHVHVRFRGMSVERPALQR